MKKSPSLDLRREGSLTGPLCCVPVHREGLQVFGVAVAVVGEGAAARHGAATVGAALLPDLLVQVLGRQQCGQHPTVQDKKNCLRMLPPALKNNAYYPRYQYHMF